MGFKVFAKLIPASARRELLFLLRFYERSFGITIDDDTDSDDIDDGMNGGFRDFCDAVLKAVAPKDPLIVDVDGDGICRLGKVQG